jgi:regulator of sigma E protease
VDFIVLAAFSFIGSSAEMVWHIAKIAIGIGFVIFVHEMGHFLAAKICGVKCEKFYIGFDVPIKIGPIELPSRLIHFQYGETEYGVGIIPLGGYVKMLGQEDHPSKQADEAERIRIEKEGDDGETRIELDPRSYAAKSVPQRMMIISAGVIMNVLFAVLMAALAYRMGVSYTPCVVGETAAGDPAWVASIQPGDLLTKIGKNGNESEQHRFNVDLRNTVIMAGFGRKSPNPIELTVKRNGHSRQFDVAPNRRGDDPKGMTSIGVLSVGTTTLAEEKWTFPFSMASTAKPAFESGDKVVAFNGNKLDDSFTNEAGDITAVELHQLFGKHADQAVVLTMARTTDDGKNVTITVPPQPRKWLGITMTMGAIVAIQDESPADAAGLRAGDVILTVQGNPVGDPLTLPVRLIDAKEVHLTLRRPDVDDPLDVTLAAVGRHQRTSPIDALVRWDRIGVAYTIDPIVAEVAEGSDAHEQGVQVGDEVLSFELEPRSQNRVKGTDKTSHQWAAEIFGTKSYGELRELDDRTNWITAATAMQQVPPGIQFRLRLKRGKKTFEAKILPVDKPNAFYARRGLVFKGFHRVRTADSIGNAMSLGYRETKERLAEVWTVLTHLIRGNISGKNLGGPIRIAAVASAETKQGFPRLLIFLTFLSANLAILNSMPFPVLDGGHFTFLIWEGIARRPVPERLQVGASMIGLVGLLLLMVYVFFNDISMIWFR